MLISSITIIIVAACMERQLGDPYINSYAKKSESNEWIGVDSIPLFVIISIVSKN